MTGFQLMELRKNRGWHREQMAWHLGMTYAQLRRMEHKLVVPEYWAERIESALAPKPGLPPAEHYAPPQPRK